MSRTLANADQSIIEMVQNISDAHLARLAKKYSFYVTDISDFLDAFISKIDMIQERKKYEGILKTVENYQQTIINKQNEYHHLRTQFIASFPRLQKSLDNELLTLEKQIWQLQEQGGKDLTRIQKAKEKYEKAFPLRIMFSLFNNLAPLFTLCGSYGALSGSIFSIASNIAESAILEGHIATNSTPPAPLDLSGLNHRSQQRDQRTSTPQSTPGYPIHILVAQSETPDGGLSQTFLEGRFTVAGQEENKTASQSQHNIQETAANVVRGAQTVVQGGKAVIQEVQQTKKTLNRFDSEIQKISKYIESLKESNNTLNNLQQNLDSLLQNMKEENPLFNMNIQSLSISDVKKKEFDLMSQINQMIESFTTFQSILQKESQIVSLLKYTKRTLHMLEILNNEISKYEEHKKFAKYIADLNQYTNNSSDVFQKIVQALLQSEVKSDYETVCHIVQECLLPYGKRLTCNPSHLFSNSQNNNNSNIADINISDIKTVVQKMKIDFTVHSSTIDEFSSYNVCLENLNNGIIFQTTYEENPELILSLLKGEKTSLHINPESYPYTLPRFNEITLELLELEKPFKNFPDQTYIHFSKEGPNHLKIGQTSSKSYISNPPMLSYKWNAREFIPHNDSAKKLKNMKNLFSSPLGDWIIQLIDADGNPLRITFDGYDLKNITMNIKVKGKVLTLLPEQAINQLHSMRDSMP